MASIYDGRPCLRCGKGHDLPTWHMRRVDRVDGWKVDLHPECVGPWMLADGHRWIAYMLER